MADPATSDGVFVYLGQKIDLVNSGDLVRVTGVAEEYYGRTEVISFPPELVSWIAVGQPLPAAVDLSPPFDNGQAAWYYEILEGMLVQLGAARVVGPTNASQETWLVRDDLGISRVFQDDPIGTGEVLCADDSGLFEVDPPAKVGDRVTGLYGILDYAYMEYRLRLLSQPTLSRPLRLPCQMWHLSTARFHSLSPLSTCLSYSIPRTIPSLRIKCSAIPNTSAACASAPWQSMIPWASRI